MFVTRHSPNTQGLFPVSQRPVSNYTLKIEVGFVDTTCHGRIAPGIEIDQQRTLRLVAASEAARLMQGGCRRHRLSGWLLPKPCPTMTSYPLSARTCAQYQRCRAALATGTRQLCACQLPEVTANAAIPPADTDLSLAALGVNITQVTGSDAVKSASELKCPGSDP